MVNLTSQCALRVGSLSWQAPNGAGMVTIVVKATYRLQPSLSPLADEQDAPLEGDVYWGDEGTSSPRVSTDLVPFKPAVDIVVTGHAHAPGGNPVTSLFARVVVGRMSKTLTIFGDRDVLLGGDLSKPREFIRMPLRWERAAGGPGTRNPIGVPREPPAGPDGRCMAPNFQPPGIYVGSIRDSIPPIGLGPIAPDWPERAQKLGRHASTWGRSFSHGPLPEGIDMAFFNCAPADQIVREVAADESIVLENLHPEHSRLVTRLGGVTPRAIRRRTGRTDEEVELRCDTLTIDTDRGVCCVTWRAQWPLRPSDEGSEIVVTDEGPVSIPQEELQDTPKQQLLITDPTEPPKPTIPSGLADTVVPAVEPEGGSPKVANVLPAPVPPPVAVLASLDLRPLPPPPSSATATATAPLVAASPPKDLPFARVRSGGLAHPEWQDTPPVPRAEVPPPTSPSVAAAIPPPVPFAPPLNEGPTFADDEATQGPPGLPPVPEVAATPPIPLAAVAAHPASGLMPTFMRGAQRVPAPATSTPFMPIEPPKEPPPAPPLVGPLAHTASPMPPTGPYPAVKVAPVESAGEPEPPAPEVDPSAFTIERCAEISAELDKKLPRNEVLARRDLSDRLWSAAQQYWKSELAREATRGGFSLRARHDQAYVRTLERLRDRSLTPEEYARLLSAKEKRQTPVVLEALDLPAPAELPVVRLWTAKLARDPRLSLEVMKAVASLREPKDAETSPRP